MPSFTLTDPAGPLVKTVQCAFENRFLEIYALLNGTTKTAEELALNRSSTGGACQLDHQLYQHFITDWLKDTSGGSGGNSNTFPSIPAAVVAVRIREGFREATRLVGNKLPITCTCEWRKAYNQTTFEVLSTFDVARNHLTILLVTPTPQP